LEPLVLVDTDTITHDEWLQWRKLGIGSSEVAAALGLNKYRSPLHVYLDKLGQLPKETEFNEAAYWGNTLEEVVAQEFSKRTGYKIYHPHCIYMHPIYKFMLANLDREFLDENGEKCILECKTTNEHNKQRWLDKDIPEEYYVQVQHQFAVTNYKRAYIACLIGGNTFVYYPVERDENFINFLYSREKEFWDKVVSKTPPEIDDSEWCAKYLEDKYTAKKASKKLPKSAQKWIDMYLDAKLDEESASKRKALASNNLKNLLGNHSVGTLGDYKISWTEVNTTSFDKTTFKKENPELFEKYVKASSFRRFTIV